MFKLNTIPLIFIGLSAFTSVSALAQVTLNIGDNTVVTAINGQEVKNSMFGKATTSYKLEPGKHVITAKYTRLYELRNDNHDILRSNNISLPVELTDNQTYTLVMANQPEDYQQAKEYAKKPTLAVMQADRIVASQQANGTANASIFSGLGSALGNVFGGGSSAIESNQQTINALQGNSSNTIAAISPTTSQPASVNSTDTLDQFMNLWLKASPAERDKIRQWIQK